jgi:hypothetical protein
MGCSSCFSDNSHINVDSCTSSGRLPTLIRRTPVTVAAMRFGSANRSHASGERKIHQATFCSPGRQSGTVPEDNGGEPVPSEGLQAPTDEEGGTPNVPQRCWAVD